MIKNNGVVQRYCLKKRCGQVGVASGPRNVSWQLCHGNLSSVGITAFSIIL